MLHLLQHFKIYHSSRQFSMVINHLNESNFYIQLSSSKYRMKFLFRICFLFFLIHSYIYFTFANQLHFIRRSNPSDLTPNSFNQTAALSDINEILIRALCFNHDLKYVLNKYGVNTLLQKSLLDQVGRVSNDPLKPVRNYWMLIFTGLSGTDTFLSGRKSDSSTTFLKVDLGSPNEVDLSELFTFPATSDNSVPTYHFSQVLTANAYRDSFLLFHSTDTASLFSVAPLLPGTNLYGSYYSAPKEVISYLIKSIRNDTLSYKNIDRHFQISESDLNRLGAKNLHSQFRQIPALFDNFKANFKIFKSSLTGGAFNFLEWVIAGFETISVSNRNETANLVFKNYLSSIIDYFDDLYGDESLGIVLFLNSTQNIGWKKRFPTFGDQSSMGIVESLAASSTGRYPFCFESEDECKSKTSSCSDHGLCVDIGSGSESCWQCECNPLDGRSGMACEFEDWSGSFWVIFNSLLILTISVLISAYMLINLGFVQGSWIFRTGHLKED